MGFDTLRISTALSILVAKGGGQLFFPIGDYAIAGSIDITGHGIVLRGESHQRSRIVAGAGNYDTVRILGAYDPVIDKGIYGVRIENLYFVEGGKGTGNTIFAQYAAQSAIVDCQIESPGSGIRLHAVNTFEVERVRIAGPRSSNSYGFWLTADSFASTDTITFKNVVVQGNAGSAHSTHGLIVEGQVNTLSAYKLYLNQMDGAGILFRSASGQADPQFATFYGLEIEGPYFEAVNIGVGRHLYFGDAQMFGSATRANVTVGASARCVNFSGGFSRAAFGPGLDIFGQQVSVSGMDLHWNSAGTAFVESGVRLNSGSSMVTITNNRCGDPLNARQFAGIRILAGADQFAVVGNTCFNNSWGIFNSAGLGTNKVVTGNAGTYTS